MQNPLIQPSSPKFTHAFPFDPAYGYDLDALLKVYPPDEPADYSAFWQSMYSEAQKVSVAPRRKFVETRGNFDIFDVEFTSLHGAKIGGWLTVPQSGPVTRGVVLGHGYGGRDNPDEWLPMSQAAAIYPCMRGQSRSKSAGIPEEAAGHVLHGIASRETYIHGGCAADIWCAGTALIDLVPDAAERLDYMGASFGGGIGALALPWDDRFQSAYLCVPSFGNHPLRLTMPCVGSGESVRTHYQEHPEIAETLRYFDAAIAATHIRIPTLVAPALFDPAVPPPGQFAVYNAITGPKEVFVLSAGHFEYDASKVEDQLLNESLAAFFA